MGDLIVVGFLIVVVWVAVWDLIEMFVDFINYGDNLVYRALTYFALLFIALFILGNYYYDQLMALFG